jgi:hypothetical protein
MFRSIYRPSSEGHQLFYKKGNHYYIPYIYNYNKISDYNKILVVKKLTSFVVF